MTKGKDWDDRERERTGKEIMEEIEHISKLYLSLIEEYANLNHLKMFKQDDDGYYSMRIYDPLYDRGFVKYAYKKTGIYFHEELFQLSLESSNELGNTDFKKGDKSVVSIEMFQIYAPLVYEYVKLNNIELPSIDDDNKKYAKKMYGFVLDKKFIDFAFKKSGITFSKEMFSYFDKQE